ncbi:MAG: isoprenylcysteine carboxylmethyltransferase family protein [Bacteroidales bacterium]|nr:isoprenylcysteine carboxylmethyltransferase family protein [Bacteroidales bacterium]
MIPLPNIIVVAVLTFLGIGMIIAFLRIVLKGGSLVGKPSANPFLFYSGKLAIFASIGLLLCKALMPSFGGVQIPGWMAWLGTGILTAGSVILLLSFFTLNESLKYGLPEEKTRLITNGLFRFTRNPLYMGLFLVNTASAIFFPLLPNILISLYCIGVHVILILGEEQFLEKRFGADWIEYKNKVKRFI